MKRQLFYLCIAMVALWIVPQIAQAQQRPNLIFITMDDMNWDSMGAYGSQVPDLTPHMDQLAAEGLRFLHAYNAAPSCVPSRNAFMTGRHSNVSGVMGFFNVESGHYETLPEALRGAGYFTGVVHKPRDTSLNDSYQEFWDYHFIIPADDKRDAPKVGNQVDAFLEQAKASGNPFFAVINIADPHKPFFGDKNQDKGGSFVPPSRIYTAKEVEVPAFLPDLPPIRDEFVRYINSVKRGDDCLGAIIESLKAHEVYDDAVIMFVSDHGMPLPYAKGSLFREGLRTPWVVRWSGKTPPGSVDEQHPVSAVDLMPTLLEIAGLEVPAGVQGRSFLPVLDGQAQPDRDYVFAQYNENAGGLMFPTRSVQTKRYNYIFNPWSDGETEFVTASTWTPTYNAMKGAARTDESVRSRFEHWIHRSVEELYDYESDPYGLMNVIDDPSYAEVAQELRAVLGTQMRGSGDYVLEAFMNRDDPDFLRSWMTDRDAEALERSQTLQWKRYKNRSGGTGKRDTLFVPTVVTSEPQ